MVHIKSLFCQVFDLSFLIKVNIKLATTMAMAIIVTKKNTTKSGVRLAPFNKVGSATVDLTRTVTNVYSPSVIYYNGNNRARKQSSLPRNVGAYVNRIVWITDASVNGERTWVYEAERKIPHRRASFFQSRSAATDGGLWLQHGRKSEQIDGRKIHQGSKKRRGCDLVWGKRRLPRGKNESPTDDADGSKSARL